MSPPKVVKMIFTTGNSSRSHYFNSNFSPTYADFQTHELLPAVLKELEPFNYSVVHDAIYVPQKHQEAVIDACNQLALEFFGATPNFR